MKKILLSLLALAASFSFALASTTYDFSASLPSGWTSNPAPNGFENPGRGAQFAATTTLTLPNVTDVAKVTIEGASNINNYTIEVLVGTTSFGTQTIPQGNDQTWEFNGTTSSGDLKIIITKATKKSVYIKTVTIDGEATQGGDSTTVTPVEGLDPNYEYAEPTIVTNTDSVGSNINYNFISNNIEVKATTGARTSTFFSVNAGQSITFTATQPMKAIVVNGYVKKDFEAEASAGELAYVDASEEEITAEQVLAVTDIDTTSLTISCVKQMRCYSVAVYFNENPEIDIEGGEEEDDYSFEWEPTEIKTINVTFDSIEVTDMTENLGYACTGLYLMSGEYEMELSVFASTIDSITILPVGTYAINDSYEENTVMASPGGYEEYDFPSYLITDFEQDPSSGDWYYNTVYYLASGTLEIAEVEGGAQLTIHSTSHFGSTINATYSIGAIQPDIDAVENTSIAVQAAKHLHGGQLYIERNGQLYDIVGRKL